MSAFLSRTAQAVIRMLCSYPLQLLLAGHLLAYPTFRRKRFFVWRAVLLTLPLLFVYDFSIQMFPQGIVPNPGIVRAFLLLPSAYLFGMLLLCYRCTAREALFSLTCAHPIQNIVFNLDWLIRLWLGIEENSIQALPIVWGAMLLVYAAAYLLFRPWMRDREGHTLPRWRVIQNAIIVILYVIFFNHRTVGSEWEIYVYFAYIFADLLAILMQIGLLHETELSLKYEVIEQLLASEQKKQKMTTENVALINRKCHDLKYQLEGLKQMQSESERSAYIGQIEDAVLFYESAVKTGNETLDLILMEKLLYCQANDIKLTCVSDGERLNILDTMDLYTLFGNAIDNAIESVSQEADKSKRIISLRIGTKGSFLSIHIENYLGHEVRLRDGLPLTSKADTAYHGFGVLSIRHTVEKYDGTMSIRTDRNLFRLDILIPIP